MGEAASRTIDALLEEALALEGRVAAGPAVIEGLAHRFAEHPDRREAHEAMVAILAESENPHVRCVAYAGIRLARAFHARAMSLEAFVLRGLADGAGAVACEAVRLAQDLRVITPRVHAALEALAAGRPSHDGAGDRADGPSWEKARERAARALAAAARPGAAGHEARSTP